MSNDLASPPRPRTRKRPGIAAAARCAVLLPCVAAAGCGSGSEGPVDGGRAMAHVRHLVEQIGPRPFGSPALERATAYIEGELKAMGLQPHRQEVVDAPSGKTIRNLWVQIDGEDPQAGPILMLGAHYDTKLTEGHAEPEHNFRFVGAIDGGGAPAVLIELARVLQARTPKPKPNVWLYWIDAEESIDFEWNDERALLGSKAFLKWLGAEKILPRVEAFVLLDLIGDENIKIDRDGNSNPKLQEIFLQAAKSIDAADRLYEFPSQQEIAYYAERGLPWGIKDDHIPFKDHGVPSVLLIDFSMRIPPHLQHLQEGQQPQVDPRYAQWWHTEKDTLDAMSADSLAFAGNLVVAALPDLEAFVMARK